MDLKIVTSAYDGAALLTLTGEIDLHSAPVLRERLSEVCAEGQRIVIVDLTGVEFLDSSALGALVSASREFSDMGGVLRLACPPPHVQKVFRITRLADVIPVFDDVPAAARG